MTTNGNELDELNLKEKLIRVQSSEIVVVMRTH
jgi:hypothetical protein